VQGIFAPSEQRIASARGDRVHSAVWLEAALVWATDSGISALQPSTHARSPMLPCPPLAGIRACQLTPVSQDVVLAAWPHAVQVLHVTTGVAAGGGGSDFRLRLGGGGGIKLVAVHTFSVCYRILGAAPFGTRVAVLADCRPEACRPGIEGALGGGVLVATGATQCTPEGAEPLGDRPPGGWGGDGRAPRVGTSAEAAMRACQAAEDGEAAVAKEVAAGDVPASDTAPLQVESTWVMHKGEEEARFDNGEAGSPVSGCISLVDHLQDGGPPPRATSHTALPEEKGRVSMSGPLIHEDGAPQGGADKEAARGQCGQTRENPSASASAVVPAVGAPFAADLGTAESRPACENGEFEFSELLQLRLLSVEGKELRHDTLEVSASGAHDCCFLSGHLTLMPLIASPTMARLSTA
jgi:hypothetical protein